VKETHPDSVEMLINAAYVYASVMDNARIKDVATNKWYMWQPQAADVAANKPGFNPKYCISFRNCRPISSRSACNSVKQQKLNQCGAH
jgi:hypothetical protein